MKLFLNANLLLYTQLNSQCVCEECYFSLCCQNFLFFFFFNEVTTLIRFDNSTAGRVLYAVFVLIYCLLSFLWSVFLIWFVMPNYEEVRNLRYLRSGFIYLFVFVYLSIIRGSHFRPILVSTEMWLASSLITLRSFIRKPEVSQRATTGRLLHANGVFRPAVLAESQCPAP